MKVEITECFAFQIIIFQTRYNPWLCAFILLPGKYMSGFKISWNAILVTRNLQQVTE